MAGWDGSLACYHTDRGPSGTSASILSRGPRGDLASGTSSGDRASPPDAQAASSGVTIAGIITGPMVNECRTAVATPTVHRRSNTSGGARRRIG